MHTVDTPPHALFTPYPTSASPSVAPVAWPPHYYVPITAVHDAPPSHLTISPVFSTPQPKPSLASASPLLTSMPAACEPEEPWHFFAAWSTLTPSALSAAGNQMPCSDTCMPRLSPSFETWPPPCSRMATSLYSLGQMLLYTSPQSWMTANGPMSPLPPPADHKILPKPRKNTNIARENEQNRKLTEMMDLGDNSVCEECVMICMDIYSDNEDKEIVVYGDQGMSSRKYKEDMYGELMNTDSGEEKIVNCNVALCTHDSVLLEKK